MARKFQYAIAVYIFGIFLIGQPAFAAARKKASHKADPAIGTVEQVLRAEVVGHVDRREKLTGILRDHPGSASAHWQSGFVRVGEAWLSFDQIPKATESDAYQEYLRRRRQSSKEPEEQLNLANFCRDKGLLEQERAHLSASLPAVNEVVESAILRRLGLVLVGNRWISTAELANWRESNRGATILVKRWSPKIEKIVEFIEGPPRQREIGMTKLRQLTDPGVIPAIEYVMCGRETTAVAAVEKLEKMPACEATLALAKQAMFSQWPEVRQRAVFALKSRRFEDFVPDLLGLLASPRKATRWSWWSYTRDESVSQITTGHISLMSCYLVARETDDQFQVDVLTTVDYRLNDLIAMRGKIFSESELTRGIKPSDNAWINGIILGKQIDMARAEAQQQRDAELALEAANDRTEELNRRAIEVLSVVSGRDPTPDPQNWWQWWSEFSDSERGEKQLVVQMDETYLGNPDAGFPVAVKRTPCLCCLCAGTPVWTDHGPQPIEQISIGDMVLSQDIESGQLAYKPVLLTTVRPPKELRAMRLQNETIVCTGGHCFWNSGSGWIKARDVESQTLLHTITGNSPVFAAKQETSTKTYNLVVADFHTYFAGKTGLLCHDLLTPQPTNNILPGLLRAKAIAK
jgi:hypothetical protein